jgi:NhaP-type Na+/H+ or K+/H+ antiporter
MGAQFIYLFVFSSLIGFIGGMLCALFLKKMKFIKMNRVQEICIIIFFAFITYTFTHEISLSPILALLFAGIALSQYAYYNVSFEAREQSW